ncbi:MAG: hypothetical protein WC969_06820 [Elusimicrobiota bacterium]|jgi:hypothetical protein
MDLYRRLTAATLCAALAWTSVPSAAFAGNVAAPKSTATDAVAPPVDPAQALKFFQQKGVLKGEDDNFKGYLFDANGQLTAIGQVIYRVFRADESKIKDYRETFDDIRESGAYTESKKKSVEKALQDVQKRYGDIGGTNAEDAWMLSAKLNAILTGVMQQDPGGKAPEYVQVETNEGFFFEDAKGIAVKMTKGMACRKQGWPDSREPDKMTLSAFEDFKKREQEGGTWEDWSCGPVGGVVTFRRDVQQQQRKMNKNRPPCAPLIPETGRYNYQTLYYDFCQREEQIDQQEKGLRIDRMMRLAQLLGKQYREDQFLKEKTLEADLIKDAKKKKLGEYDSVCKRKVADYFELIECRLEDRAKYLAAGRKALEAYRKRVEQFKGRDFILPEEVSGLQGESQVVFKSIVLSFAESQRFQAINQLESLGYEAAISSIAVNLSLIKDAPDAETLLKALREAPLTEEEKGKYKTAGKAVAARIQQLLAALERIKRNALSADPVTGMGAITNALQATQAQLGEVGLDYILYLSMPGLSKVAKDEDSGVTPWVTLQGAKLWSKTPSWLGGEGASGYVRNRAAVTKYQPQLLAVTRLIAAEDFKGARKALLALDPDAVMAYREVDLRGDSEFTDAQRIQASLKKSQTVLNSVAQVHVWTGMVINTVIWSAALAVAAPVASAALSGVAKVAFTTAKALDTMGKVGKYSAVLFRVVGAIAENTAIRLATLSPAADKLYASTKVMRAAEASMVRFVNAGARMSAFSFGLSGTTSGVMAAGTHAYQETIGGGHSPFASAGEAFGLGYQQGAKWATESWHPMLLYAGVPSNAFEGVPVLSQASESLATRGLFGNVSAAVDSGLRTMGMEKAAQTFGKVGLGGLVQAGGWKAGVATALSMGDNIAKYYVFSTGIGAAATELNYRFNTIDGENIERRIKRSEKAGLAWMEKPLWLLLPTYPARYEAQAKAMRQSQQGYEEYKKAGELDKIANAAADITELGLKGSPTSSYMEKIFNFRWRGESGQNGTFKVTKQMKYDAIREELPLALGGDGKKGAVNPLRFYEVSQMGDNKQVGRLIINDEVRDQAQGLFEKAVLDSPKLAKDILASKLGKPVEGFGTVSLGHQEEVARILYRANAEGRSVPKPQLDASLALLKPYIESENMVQGKARELVEALAKNKTPSKAFQNAVENFMNRTLEWKDRQGSKHVDASKHYTALLDEFRAQIEGQKSALSPVESSVLTKSVEYLEAIQKRFQYFNRPEAFSARVKSSLEALSTEYSSRPAKNADVQDFVDGVLKRTLEWTAQNRGASDPVVRIGEKPPKPGETPNPGDFLTLVSDLGKGLEGLKGKVSVADYQVAESAVKEVVNSPWILKNAKGDGLPGWRDVQFEGMMYFLYSVSQKGTQVSDVVRTFLQMKTGAGKTLLAFEGLLPFADADAAMRGKQTMFLTVQSNLESQARVDFRSLKKLTTKMTIDTWEGFKTKIAEGKLKVKSVAEDYWLLGDEMDGAAQQPALTIGETTAGVSKDAVGYKMLKDIGRRLQTMLDRGPQEAQKSLEAQVRRMQAAADAMPAGEAREAVLQNAKEMMQVSRELMLLETKAFTPSGDKGRALERANGWLRRSGGNALPEAEAKALQDLVAELKATPGPKAGEQVQRLDAKLRELQTGLAQTDLARFEGRMQKLIGKQDALLTALPEGEARSMLAESGRDLRTALAERRTRGAVDLKGFRADLENILLSQKSVLVQSEPAGETTAKGLRRMAKLARSEGHADMARQLESQALRVSEGGAQARADLRANADGLRQVVREGKPGWETRARELLTQREGLVDRAVTRENPIYEIFSKMRQDMYSMVYSKTRVQDDGQVLMEAPKAAGTTLTESGKKFLAAMESLAGKDPAAQPLVAKARDLKARWDARAAEISKLLDKPVSAEHQAVMTARQTAYEQMLKADDALRAAKAEFDAADAPGKTVLKDKVAGAQRVVDEWNGKFSDINARLKPFEAPQRELMRAQLEGLRAEAQGTAAAWKTDLASFKGPEADAARVSILPTGTAFESQLKRVDFTSQRAVEAWQRRIDGVPATELAARYALQWTGLRWTLSKIPGLGDAGFLKPVTASTDGLARTHARGLVKAFLNDPFLPPDVRWRMFWEILPSTILPRGVSGQGSGWVRTELFNLARGYLDNPANIRVDNITGRVNVIHNGQWFESMDTPTRRYWELEYGTDLTLPYEHKTMVTMNDLIRDNHNVRFVGFSGTTGKEFYSYMNGNKVNIVGKGSEGAPNVRLEIHENPAGKFQTIGEAVNKAMADPNGLVVLSLSDTRMVKAVRKYLIKTGKLQPENIAMVFSDSEFLRLNRPNAKVGEQMNLDGMTTGKVKVLMLDTRVGGRGLDLNFKGDRGNPSPTAFKGYKDFQMLIVDPQEMSGVHSIQAQGRIDLGRILPSTPDHPTTRTFKLVMDIQTAQRDPVFQKMMREEPVLQQLRESPECLAMSMREGKLIPDWGTVHRFVEGLEQRQASPKLTELYRQTVDKYLTMRQNEVELEQLRSAGVLKDASKYQNPLYRGLEGR